jgi:hypothetical protein
MQMPAETWLFTTTETGGIVIGEIVMRDDFERFAESEKR